ncbi:hypothetical protein GCM10009555_012330 [Acrocarpospora macrocephala]|uniref:Uncharacterized protein n=2 Tax=Acrocarpospora macrocephala TaxID=150177 RepID=A0A5M3X5T4_9ACTN|nr:hypothetical protein Amac_100720 [Acrocarpospora macrocephala]
MTPIEVQARAHDLIEAGKFAEAVKTIAEESQVSRQEATEVANVLRGGHLVPDFPGRWPDDLSDSIRALLHENKRKQAIFLVRSEKDLSAADAEAFIRSFEAGATP